jgi:hypothetical protein
MIHMIQQSARSNSNNPTGRSKSMIQLATNSDQSLTTDVKSIRTANISTIIEGSRKTSLHNEIRAKH